MLQARVIQSSGSAYINPLVTVIKKDGAVRQCLDARKLNYIMEEDCGCPEPAEVLFQRYKERKIMSSLDMTSSFWQIPLHPDSRKFTAFQQRGKSYEFTVVPFGLKTSTAALVRGLDHTLKHIGEHVITFVDDTLITQSHTSNI